MAHHDCPYDSQLDEPNSRPGMQVRAGDVYTVRESVFTPVYDLLRGCLDGNLRVQANEAYHSKVAEQRFKRRPCIVMQGYHSSPTTPQVRRLCLVGTLDHQPISSLPKIFQEFCIPVFPHTCLEDHIHSMPEWEPKDAWVIAIMFDSSRRLLGKWREEYAGIPARTRTFGVQATLYLKNKCTEKRSLWMTKCRQDPTHAREHFKECRDHKTPATDKSIDALSMLSGISKPSLRTSIRAPFKSQTNASTASLAHPLRRIRVSNSDRTPVRSKASNFTLHRELLAKESANGLDLTVF
ncbi:hypothetical protein L226DRAFT_563587 [Lentinus tigrinus ALCF2SS1-7]|uniref:Uncharacterized protein n=1 Tax=Lentinus tigrinus ALCF2SS1-6 TaxID=1328759 RepID=A0A5C2S315_9APHY|nr:hypothetical protein L227DRAFT_602225 [Lentinus tigrinus ALCF2SS1-6]RPD68987.1 hypothetical protein L226DRAFT_563587 [Lentinus tigrinus ALCF2SS1-7]